MSKPKSDGLSRRGFLASSLGAVTVAKIGCRGDDGAESSTKLGSGGSGGVTGGTGFGGAATGGTTGNLGSGGSTASAPTGNGGSQAQVGGNVTSPGGSGGIASTGGAATGGETTGTTSSSTGEQPTATGGTLADGGAHTDTSSDTETDTDSDTDTDIDANTATDSATGKVQLAAACGTYCGACPAYIATHSEDEQIQYSSPWGTCDGCLGGGRLAAHCRNCNIRLCALDKQDGARCTFCEELPCYRITNLINLGNYPHRQEYLPNLAKMRDMGVGEWVKYEDERWRCPKCRLPMAWYDMECVRCGEPRSASLFPVTTDTPRPYS